MSPPTKTDIIHKEANLLDHTKTKLRPYLVKLKRKMYGKSSKLNFGVFFIDFNERLD